MGLPDFNVGGTNKLIAKSNAQIAQLDAMHKQGRSWEDMSSATGMPVWQIRNWSRGNYPGYGGNAGAAGKSTWTTDVTKIANGMANLFNKAGDGGGNTAATTGWGGGGWGGGSSSTEARDRADAVAKYDEEIRQASDAMAGLGRKEEIGIANINKSIHNANVQADNDFNVAKGKYQMQTNDAINQHRKTRDQIESDAADKIRSARGIFAAGGSGDSSFSKTLAPFKISEAASKQQGQVQDTYAKNRRDMDINYMAVENAYKANKKNIRDEGDQRINSLRQKIATTRQDLEGRIRNANIGKSQARGSSLASAIASQNASRDRINAMSGEIDELGRDKSIAIDKVQWKAPELSSYDPKDVTVKSADPNAEIGGVNDQIAPNLQPLLDPENKKKKETGMF